MADLGRGVDMTPYYYASETLNLFLVCLLLAFHVFRTHHDECSRSKSNNNNKPRSPKLCGILNLKIVSYIMLSWYIARGITILFTFFTNKQWKYLNASSCHFIAVFSATLIQFARYNLHLFLAIRSRLSSYNETYSIWSKIGFLVMTSDLIYMVCIWIFSEWTIMDISPDGTQCVTIGFDIMSIVWVILNDVIVSGYSLCVFILPLRNIIAMDKQQENIKNNNQQQKQSNVGRSVGDIARRIMWCSLGALSTTAIACGIALTFGILQGIMSPLLMFIRCYLVVMQFSDIDINEIDENKKFWRALIILFQWNQWKCCCSLKKKKKKKKGEITNNTTTIQIANSGSNSSNTATITIADNSSNPSSNPSSPKSATISIESPPIPIR